MEEMEEIVRDLAAEVVEVGWRWRGYWAQVLWVLLPQFPLVVLEVLKFHFTVEQVEGGGDNPGTTSLPLLDMVVVVVVEGMVHLVGSVEMARMAQ
jgi:hypothetical protein